MQAQELPNDTEAHVSYAGESLGGCDEAPAILCKVILSRCTSKQAISSQSITHEANCSEHAVFSRLLLENELGTTVIEELCDAGEKGQEAAEEKENKCAEHVLSSQWSVFAVRSATLRVARTSTVWAISAKEEE